MILKLDRIFIFIDKVYMFTLKLYICQCVACTKYQAKLIINITKLVFQCSFLINNDGSKADLKYYKNIILKEKNNKKRWWTNRSIPQ